MGAAGLTSNATSSGARLYTPAFIALCLAEFAYFTAQGLEIPLAPLFAAGPLGADKAGVGITVGALSLTALVLRPTAGRWADARGRRPLLIGGALLYGLATAAHALAPNLVVMIGLRLLLGVADAFFFVAGFAVLADLAPRARMGEALSINSLSLYLGIAIGPIVGQTLLGVGGFTLAWLGAAGIVGLAVLLAIRIPETAPERPADAPPVALIHRAALLPGSLLLAGISAMAGFFAFVAIHAESIGVTDWSLVLLQFGLIVVVTRLIFARLPDRMPPYRLGAGALALTATGIATVALIPTPVGLFVGDGILAAGVAFTTPAFFAAVMTRVEPHERGAAMGTMTIAIDLAFGGGPMLFGLVAAAGGIPVAFIAGSGVAAAGAIGAVVALRRGATRIAPV